MGPYVLLLLPLITEGVFPTLNSRRTSRKATKAKGLSLTHVEDEVSTKLLRRVVDAGVPQEVSHVIAKMLSEAEAGDTQGFFAEPLTVYRYYRGNNNDTSLGLANLVAQRSMRESYPGGFRSLMHDVSGTDYYTNDVTRSLDGCRKFYNKKPLTHEGKLLRKYACIGRGGYSMNDEPVMLVNVDAIITQGLSDWDRRGLLVRSFTTAMEDMFQCVRAMSVDKQKLVVGHVVVDCKNLGLKDLKMIGRLDKIKAIDSNYFPPAMFGTMSIINGPAVLKLLIKAVSPLLTQRGRKMVRVMGEDYSARLQDELGIDVPSMMQDGTDHHKRQCVIDGELLKNKEDKEYNTLRYNNVQ